MNKDDFVKLLWENNIFIEKKAYDLLSSLKEEDLDIIFKEAIKSNINRIDEDFINRIIRKNSNNNKENAEKKENNINKKQNKVNIKDFFNIKENKQNIEKESNNVILIESTKKHIGEEIELSVKEMKETKEINILKKFEIQKNKPDVISWISYYKQRLDKIKKILREHSEMRGIYPLNKIPENEEVAIVGLIYDKKITEKGVIFVIEDGNAVIKAFVSKDNENIDFKVVKDIPLDSVIGLVGTYKNRMFFVNNVILPDVPIRKPKTFGEDDVYILFTGDWQIGNKYTFYDLFDRFLKFVNGKTENEKINEIARKIGYIIIIGDVADGVGVYPEQKEELILKTYEDQYKSFEDYILKIPESIKTIIIPGNHDIPRLAEPQPELPRSLLKESYSMKNIYYLSNPSYVKIHNSIVGLLYHGYVLDWLVSNISFLRERGGYEKPGELMKFMLMLRLIFTSHGSNPYVPYINEDASVIEIVPDFFHTGHIHRASYDEYRGIDLINSSTFQDITPYQRELGHKPEPGILFLRNIKNGEVFGINLFNFEIKKLRDKVI
ncbi:MAG: metallophosphoesterase [Candidatus Nanopusillus sp.]|nr:metallophosphoesterase [Candidatus Nanopusillus sp.]